MSSILNTTKLIASIKRRAMLPRSQETFTDSDFLDMATEEVNLGLMPFIMKAHEEALVYSIDIPLEADRKKYPIPSRAQGNKLRDVFLVDNTDELYEMFRYNLDEQSDFNSWTNSGNSRGFYLMNNEVVLVSPPQFSSQSLRMFFYLRPNSLVLPERSGTITQITNVAQVDNIDPQSASISSISLSGIVSSTAHGYSNGDKVEITGTDSTPSADGTYTISVIDANSFSIEASFSVAATTGASVRLVDCYVLSLSQVPKHFNQSIFYDLVQNISPNKITNYDLPCNSVDFVVKQVSIPVSSFSDAPVVGQYVTSAEETIVPNIPTELHPILAQRVAIACLEAMGDEQNKQSAERKLSQMELNGMTLIDNRTEGSQQKIKNRHSSLKQSSFYRAQKRFGR
jgi:hypothetical protein